jgi:hypothetical protein
MTEGASPWMPESSNQSVQLSRSSLSESDPIYLPSLNHSLKLFSNGCSESGTVWGLSGNLSIFPRSRAPLSPNPTQSLLHLSVIPQSSYTPHESLNHPLFNSILCTHHTIFVLQTRSPATNPSNLSTPFTFIRHLHIILCT